MPGGTKVTKKMSDTDRKKKKKVWRRVRKSKKKKKGWPGTAQDRRGGNPVGKVLGNSPERCKGDKGGVRPKPRGREERFTEPIVFKRNKKTPRLHKEKPTVQKARTEMGDLKQTKARGPWVVTPQPYTKQWKRQRGTRTGPGTGRRNTQPCLWKRGGAGNEAQAKEIYDETKERKEKQGKVRTLETRGKCWVWGGGKKGCNGPVPPPQGKPFGGGHRG